MDNRAIGIFDSGVGGLTVARRVMDEMPREKIIYFGDTARVPYGSKSKATITRFSSQIAEFLISKDVKAIVIACNTADSYSGEKLKESLDIPVFGVIASGAAAAAVATQNNKIGVIGTIGTIGSNAYNDKIKKSNPLAAVITKACPLFVPLAEEGWTNNDVTRLTAKRYLSGIVAEGIDTLVLGCTHYPLLRRCIQAAVGDNVTLIDPAEAAAKTIKAYFEQNDMLCGDGSAPKREFYISDSTPMFETICKQALGEAYEPTVVNLEK